MERNAPHQLHIKMALAKCPFCCFADQGKGLGKQIILGFAVRQTVAQLTGHVAQGIIILAA